MLHVQEQKYPDLAKAMRAQMPCAFLYYGFTTLIDLNDNTGQARRWNKLALHPDVYSCGPALMMANGYPSTFVPQKFRYRAMPNFIYDTRQARRMPADMKPQAHTPKAAVSRAQKAGAICIKAFIETGFGPNRGKLPVFSSDTPSGTTYANPPGLNGYREIQDMADFGLSPMQIFKAITMDNAKAFGLDSEVGTIDIGKTANLLLLNSNPLQNTKAYNDIALVILRGRPLQRDRLLPDQRS